MAQTAISIDGFSTATAMLAALRAREISSVELLELHLRRIERHNPALNAVIIKDYERARAAAIEADAARASGDDRPLLGLPLTIKDAIDVQGLPTVCGATERVDAIAETDATIVPSVRAAGAVIMGKTNVPPYAGDYQVDNPVFGRTNNPWRLDRIPGGSSGGSAAVVAAGLSPLEYGSDIGGSIRFPAAWCGIYGHRPSAGIIPVSGHFPGSTLPNPTFHLNTLGPFARSIEDLEMAFDLVAGPEPGEEVGWRLDLPPARHDRLADFRVGIFPSADWRPVDTEVSAKIESLAATLRAAGATVGEAAPAGYGDGKAYHALFQRIIGAISASRLDEVGRQERAAMFRAGNDPFGPAWAEGALASAADYITWHTERERYRVAWRALFQEWDVVVAPQVIVPAPPHSTVPFNDRTIEVNGQAVAARAVIYPSALPILTGLPATAFPVGLSADGLPIGIQAIGPYLEDRTTIRFAGLVGAEIGGYQRPPGYDED
jgi:amidase